MPGSSQQAIQRQLWAPEGQFSAPGGAFLVAVTVGHLLFDEDQVLSQHNPQAQGRLEQHRFTVTRQLRYSGDEAPRRPGAHVGRRAGARSRDLGDCSIRQTPPACSALMPTAV